MIKQSERVRAWFFHEPEEPIAVTIYEPCTDSETYLVIVEEPSEGGPDTRTFWHNKVLVAAAFGLHIDETELHDHFDVIWEGYIVPIPQVLYCLTEKKYFVGTLTKSPYDNGMFDAEKPHTARFTDRKDAVASLLSDKRIWERLDTINKAEELPF